MLRYRSPKSGSTTTTSLPAFSGRRATLESGRNGSARGDADQQTLFLGQPSGQVERVVVVDGDDLVDQAEVEHRRDEPGADALDRVWSLLTPDYAAMDRAELEEVERLINEQILRNEGVDTKILPLDQAIATGAMALFGEKYGEEVRVVTVPGFSRELCGGTHVRRTGDIGVCKIVYEGSISAGVRRIEAVTGEGALHQYQETSGALRRIADLLHASEPELAAHVEKLLANERALSRQVDHLKEKLAQAAVGALEAQAQTVNGARVLAARLDGMDRQQMRSLADALRNKWKSAVVVLASGEDGSVTIVAAVTKDLTAKVQAGKLVSAVALATGGKGGGRPDMAEGGGRDAAALDQALAAVSRDIVGKL